MLEWLDQNKEWIFSGAGIAMITGIVAVLSSLITLWVRLRNERAKKAKLIFLIDLRKYQIETAEADVPLSVSYKGNLYENLCQFNVSIENTGRIGIQGQQLLFQFPIESQVIEVFEKYSTKSIQSEVEELKSTDKLEFLWKISRLEQNDKVSFSYILNTNKYSQLKCEPRGVDDIEYSYAGSKSAPEAYHLIAYLAFFVLCGSIPILGPACQALIIILASSKIISFFRELEINKWMKSSYEFYGVSIEGDGRFEITNK